MLGGEGDRGARQRGGGTAWDGMVVLEWAAMGGTVGRGC